MSVQHIAGFRCKENAHTLPDAKSLHNRKILIKVATLPHVADISVIAQTKRSRNRERPNVKQVFRYGIARIDVAAFIEFDRHTRNTIRPDRTKASHDGLVCCDIKGEPGKVGMYARHLPASC